MPNVYLAMPSHGSDDPLAKVNLWSASQRKDVRIFPGVGINSLLTHNFNLHWCNALNGRQEWGLTHFAMIHSDVVAEAGWLDKLLIEQEKVKADVLSVVIPLKDPNYQANGGPTSCGIWQEEQRFHRFTMKELKPMPETFTGEALCVNTGCWVCDFTQPWVEQIHFRQTDKIVKRGEKFAAETFSEDWNFSLDCHKLGVKVYATFCVKVKHCGRYEWSNGR